jgi:hypothetical protein
VPNPAGSPVSTIVHPIIKAPFAVLRNVGLLRCGPSRITVILQVMVRSERPPIIVAISSKSMRRTISCIVGLVSDGRRWRPMISAASLCWLYD